MRADFSISFVDRIRQPYLVRQLVIAPRTPCAVESGRLDRSGGSGRGSDGYSLGCLEIRGIGVLGFV